MIHELRKSAPTHPRTGRLNFGCDVDTPEFPGLLFFFSFPRQCFEDHNKESECWMQSPDVFRTWTRHVTAEKYVALV